MDNSTNTSGNLLRIVGFMGICVGAAWALQVLGFGGEGSFGRLMWVVASASIAGAGTGMIVAAGSLQKVTAKA